MLACTETSTSANNLTGPLPLGLITRRCVQQHTCIISEWIPLQLLPIFSLCAGNQASMINVAGMIHGCPPLFGVPTGAPLFLASPWLDWPANSLPTYGTFTVIND